MFIGLTSARVEKKSPERGENTRLTNRTVIDQNKVCNTKLAPASEPPKWVGGGIWREWMGSITNVEWQGLQPSHEATQHSIVSQCSKLRTE